MTKYIIIKIVDCNVFYLAWMKTKFMVVCGRLEEGKALQEIIPGHIEKQGRAGAERIREEPLKTDKEEGARARVVDIKKKVKKNYMFEMDELKKTIKFLTMSKKQLRILSKSRDQVGGYTEQEVIPVGGSPGDRMDDKRE